VPRSLAYPLRCRAVALYGDAGILDVTGLLRAWGQGDETALQQLVPLVYEQLRASARRYLARERPADSQDHRRTSLARR